MKYVTHTGKLMDTADMVVPHLHNALFKLLKRGFKLKYIHLQAICKLNALAILYAHGIEEYCDNTIKIIKQEFINRNRKEDYDSIVKSEEDLMTEMLVICSQVFTRRVARLVDIRNYENFMLSGDPIRTELDAMDPDEIRARFKEIMKERYHE